MAACFRTRSSRVFRFASLGAAELDYLARTVPDNSGTARALRTLESVYVVHVTDGWSALEQLVEGDFDVAVCALTLCDWSGAKLYTMVAKQRPKMAARIVFIAAEAAIADAPPSASLGRVLARPVDPVAVLRLIDQWRAVQ